MFYSPQYPLTSSTILSNTPDSPAQCHTPRLALNVTSSKAQRDESILPTDK